MIIVESTSDDSSTNDVLDWIFSLSNEKVTRFNDITFIENITYKITNQKNESVVFRANGKTFNNSRIKSFWYRRGEFTYNLIKITQDHYLLNSKIQSNNFKEQKHLNYQLYNLLTKIHGEKINTHHDNLTNKISNLAKAKDSGLNIPDTLITNHPKELRIFSDKYEKLISKDIKFNPIKISFNDYVINIISPVRILDKNKALQLFQKNKEKKANHFSLFQQYITKKYELRIFYLKGKFYTMVIFSQANEKTKIDFRNYDTERPNRCVPYQLPQEIEEKLHHFMQSIDMNCGSIDMIYTPEGEYVFLEVNPVGQFQWVSKNCNYDIERQIAIDLIKEKT
ncbi:grasp-with-spasm system ATP-grasp peptide maturase [Chryseobacterium tongliaoense]|uniref:grasp-with-spasm system ATP-grasp peptide maturase n=1 Tax=Chryseobacterium tongliaoense TaxID=3240933 RepID=UPI0035175DEF